MQKKTRENISRVKPINFRQNKKAGIYTSLIINLIVEVSLWNHSH